MWNMHDITTEEQARKNRESCNGKNTGVEDMTLPDPTTQQSALVSVVTGAMTGAFAVWMGHEK